MAKNKEKADFIEDIISDMQSAFLNLWYSQVINKPQRYKNIFLI
jgi:hypothetical protein